LNFRPLLRDVQDDPWNTLKRCKTAWSTTEMGYHRHLYVFAATGISFARSALEREDLRVSLYNQPVFSMKMRLDSKVVPTPRKMLRRSFQYLLDGASGPAYERATNYAVGLEDFVTSSIAIEDIPAAIEAAGGVEELYKKKKEAKNRQDETADVKSDTMSDNANVISLVERISQSPFIASPNLSEPYSAEPAASPSHDRAAELPRAPRPPRTKFDDRKHLLIEANDHIMGIVLSLQEHERAILKVRNDGEEDDGLHRLVATQAKVVEVGR
jgi:hypothetical protein